MPALSIEGQLSRCALWPERFSAEEWTIYKRVLAGARERGLRFAVGGGLAAMTYAGQWRNTKDLDLYAMKRDREAMIKLLTDLGLQDYYEKQPYDRKWIYRSYRGETIVDLIWAMANQRAEVEESWLEGPEVEAGGERFRLLAPEDALWSKLYVLQRDRSDWPDSLNLLYGVGPDMNWRRLLANLGEDVPLLSGVLCVFGWLCRERALQFPSWLWRELGIRSPEEMGEAVCGGEHARLLDSRGWFTPTLKEEQ